MSESAAPAPAATSVLTATDLSVTYANGAVGVSGVSLTVAEGTIAAILGRNGAG